MTPSRFESQTEKSIDDMLRAFVVEAVENFPHLKGRLVVYDVRRNVLIPGPGFAPEQAGFDSEEAMKHMMKKHEVTKSAHKEKVLAYALNDEDYGLSFIFLNEKVAKREEKALSPARQREIMDTLYHELGHLAIPGGISPHAEDGHANLLSENIAEAFAQMMLYKKHGPNALSGTSGTALYFNNSLRTAYSFVFRQQDLQYHHYETVREIVACRHKIDFSQMNMAEIAELARRFAATHTPSVSFMEDLGKAFAPVSRMAKRKGAVAALALLADTVEKTPYPHVARLGAEVSEVALYKYRKKMDSATAENLRARFNAVAKRVREDGILYNVPQKPVWHPDQENPSRAANNNQASDKPGKDARPPLAPPGR